MVSPEFLPLTQISDDLGTTGALAPNVRKIFFLQKKTCTCEYCYYRAPKVSTTIKNYLTSCISKVKHLETY